MRRAVAVVVVVSTLAAASCAGSSGGGGGEATDDAPAPEAREVLASAPEAGACDDIDPAACLLPWPNDRFTRADDDAATGRRLDLPTDGMPANADGTRIDPAEWNRNDGFSPASHLLTVIEDLDPEASDLPVVTDLGGGSSSLALIEVANRTPVPAWAELDASAPDPASAPLGAGCDSPAAPETAMWKMATLPSVVIRV